MIIAKGMAKQPALVMEEVTDPEVVARNKAQSERFWRNVDWLSSHWEDLLPQALGKFVAVAGQEAFLADTSEEAWAAAEAAHPEDNGVFCRYVSPMRGPKIYANHGEIDP